MYVFLSMQFIGYIKVCLFPDVKSSQDVQMFIYVFRCFLYLYPYLLQKHLLLEGQVMTKTTPPRIWKIIQPCTSFLK